MRKLEIALILILFLFSFNFVLAETLLGSNNNVGVNFDLTINQLSCVRTSTLSFWQNNTINRTTYNISNPGQTGLASCFNSESSSDTCCPTGYRCDGSPGEDGVCVLDEVDFCMTIETENGCNAYRNNPLFQEEIASFSGGLNCGQVSWQDSDGNNCFNVTSCGCVWDTDFCGFGYSLETFCENSPSIDNGNCVWIQQSQENRCDQIDGKLIVTYNASGTLASENDPNCQDKILEYPCSASVKLPFFSLFNLILSVLGITFVYFVFRKKILP